MKVSPDMDLILWQLAESGDSGAISRFEMTHPALKAELASRVAALEGLRGMKPIPGEAMIPPFKPVPVAPIIPPAWIATGVVGAIVIGTASFFVTRNLVLTQPEPVRVAQRQVPQPSIAVPKVNTAPVEVPDEPVVNEEQPEVTDLPTVRQGDDDESEINLPRDRDLDTDSVILPKHTLAMNGVALTTVIKAICKDANVSPVFAPGFEDKKVSVKLEGETRIGLLKQLAKEYGFSAVETGKDEVLIIPAPDEGPIDPAEPIVR